METYDLFPTLQALKLPHPGLRALFFDMDGTLFQTEEMHGEVLRGMARDWGIQPPFPAHQVEERLKGYSDAQVVEMARSWRGFPAGMTTEAFVEEKNRRLLALIPTLDSGRWSSPALARLLADGRADGLCTALVTSSEDVVTHALLKASGLRGVFDVVITLQDVAHAKPHPEPYLRAMLALNVGPRETVVFEDSVPGLAAARAAGVRVVKADWWKGWVIPA
jgi:HAD superfamily hydrolase (TIGR01509 family)